MAKKQINRIDINKSLDEPGGFDVHDYLRDGRQYNLSPRKLSAFLKIMYKKINALVDAINKIERKGGGLP